MTEDMDKTAIGTMEMDNRTQVVTAPGAEATQYAANVDCPVCHTPNPPSETYCIDCGFLLTAEPVAIADMPEAASVGTLVSSDGTREFALKPGENSVGRENCDVLLTHNSVSRRHAKIMVENGHVYVEDTGSTNGTTVDGKRIPEGEKAEITDGSEVVFGSAALTLKAAAATGEGVIGEGEAPAEPGLGEQDAEVAVPSPSPPQAGEGRGEGDDAAPDDTENSLLTTENSFPAKLVSKDGVYSFDLREGVNTIGRRDGSNDIVIPDPYCSGHHADLALEEGKFTLTDAGSTNGTMVNGVRLEPNVARELQEGDEVTLGQVVCTIEVQP